MNKGKILVVFFIQFWTTFFWSALHSFMTWNISHWTSRISPTCWQTPMNFLVWFLENQPTAKISRKKLAHRHPQTGRASSKNNPRIVRTFKHHLTIIKTYEHIILKYSNSQRSSKKRSQSSKRGWKCQWRKNSGGPSRDYGDQITVWSGESGSSTSWIYLG